MTASTAPPTQGTSSSATARPPQRSGPAPRRSIELSDSTGPHTLTLARPIEVTVIVVAPEETGAVHRAVGDLAQDLHRVCAADTLIEPHRSTGSRIVVGTLGHSPLVEEAVADETLDVGDLYGPDGSPHWEGFLVREVAGTVWIVGADRRGTVFGIYELCEAMGVSPWSWWADVPVRTREHVSVPRGLHVADHPSVKYRGIFLNDEEELEAWARTHTDDGTLGPQTYERVFELLLRLKGNYLWPAMHVNAFNDDPRNGRLAHERGVVIGTSHCDMLLRSNQHEWQPWVKARSSQVSNQVPEYDYSLPGENRGALHEYWAGSIQQNRDYEVTWTLGMRGIHDSGFHTRAIDEDDTLNAEQKHRARVQLLSRVITDQRSLLQQELGAQAAAHAPQTFVPYKEVLPLYDDGLELPDDVVLVWSDDSYGHIRRYPTPAELTRSGGHGLYYHSSYWSPPSRSYLWISSTPLAQMREELTKAWARGIQTLWVDNVGSLKPLEQDVEYFLRCAWEAGEETTTADPLDYLQHWVDRCFTGGHGRRVAHILQEFAQLNDVRKVEQLTNRVFSQTAHGDEASRRLAQLRRLYDDVNAVHAALPEAERDAFMQLVAFKVHAAYLTNAQFLFADRSTLAHEQGKLAAADHWLEVSRRFDGWRRALIAHYNTVLAGGKWNGIMTPDAFPPPAAAQHPAGTPALALGPGELGVVAWGEDLPSPEPQLSFSPDGTSTKWIEVFTTGASSLDFTITADEWIHVPVTAGTVTTEKRLMVSIPDPVATAGRCGKLTVHSRSSQDGTEHSVTVRVTVQDLSVKDLSGQAVTAPAHDPAGTEPSHLEADGVISLPAVETARRSAAANSTWVPVAHLGRGGGALLQTQARPREHGVDSHDGVDSGHGDRSNNGDHGGGSGPGAVAEYRIHLVTPGAHLLELHRYPSLCAGGRLRVGVSIDEHSLVLVESAITDEYHGTWTDAVVEAVDRLHHRLPWLAAGEHVLRLHAVDRDMALSRLVIHTGPIRRSALGPPSSRRRGLAWNEPVDPAPDEHDLSEPQRVCRDVYRIDVAQLPPPPVIHVPREYWNTETTFTPNLTTPQHALGAPRPGARPDGTKDLLAGMASEPVQETDGVLAIDLEQALLDTAAGWRTPSLDAPAVSWNHTQAETRGGTGLALHVDVAGRQWNDPVSAPGLHVAVHTRDAGTYRVWALVKFDGDDDDSFALALDGTLQPLAHQHSGGSMFAFGLTQAWMWIEISDLDIPAGPHTLSVLAVKSRLRITRLYLTRGGEQPPADAQWPSR